RVGQLGDVSGSGAPTVVHKTRRESEGRRARLRGGRTAASCRSRRHNCGRRIERRARQRYVSGRGIVREGLDPIRGAIGLVNSARKHTDGAAVKRIWRARIPTDSHIGRIAVVSLPLSGYTPGLCGNRRLLLTLELAVREI